MNCLSLNFPLPSINGEQTIRTETFETLRKFFYGYQLFYTPHTVDYDGAYKQPNGSNEATSARSALIYLVSSKKYSCMNWDISIDTLLTL